MTREWLLLRTETFGMVNSTNAQRLDFLKNLTLCTIQMIINDHNDQWLVREHKNKITKKKRNNTDNILTHHPLEKFYYKQCKNL